MSSELERPWPLPRAPVELTSLDRTTAILESIADAFFSVDRQWRFVVVNPAAARAPFGRPASELLGRVIWDVFPTLPGTRIHQHYLDAVEKQSREHYEARSPLNGRWYEVFMFPHPGGLDVYLRDIDDRKKVEEALRESEERYRLLIEHAVSAVAVHQIILDAAGVPVDYVFLSANASFETHTGLRVADVIGRRVTEVLPGIAKSNLIGRYGQVALTGESVSFEQYFEPLDRHFLISVYRVGEGRFATAFTDISERKHAESLLRATLQRFYVVLSSMYSAVLLVTNEGRVEFANAAFCKLFGLEDAPADLVGLSSPRVLEKIKSAYLNPEEATARIREILARGEPVKGEEVRMAGSRVCLRDYVPLRVEGTLHGRLWVHFEMTERIRAEEALTLARGEAERRAAELQAVLDVAPVAVWIAHDPECLRITGNRCADELIMQVPRGANISASARPGASSVAIKVFRDGRELKPEELPAQVAAATGNAVEPQVLKLLFPEGRAVHLLEGATPLRDAEGRVRGAVAAGADITALKRAEEALAAANLQLAESDVRKNEFLAVLSHELRNPLTPVRNSLYVLERAVPGGDQAKRALEVIGRQSGQLTRLVDDLLDVTRISRNKIQLQRCLLDLNEVVRRTVDDYHSVFEEKGIAFEMNLSPERLPLLGDPARLAQMVGNLLQNAAKFTPVGGRVIVGLEASPQRAPPGSGRESTRCATLRVIDSGVGIEAAMSGRLFQPFTQAEATLDRSRGGLGLGLALVKGLVELHGGKVRAHSDGPGAGAEFVVELPLDEAGAAAESPRGRSCAVARRRVLIVEDNIDAADSLREALELSGHLVEVAYDGPAGLAKAREFKPEVVLCDLGLPGMDGFEVAKAFRADASLRGTVLVALSGYALPGDLQRASEAGFHRHLAKPPTIEKLEQLLAERPGIEPVR